jgi:hypothetical protein
MYMHITSMNIRITVDENLEEEENADASEDADGGSKKKGGIHIYIFK